MLQGLVQSMKRPSDIKYSTIDLIPFFVFGSRRYWKSLCNRLAGSIWTLTGSAPIVFPKSVEFLVHTVSGMVLRSSTGVCIKYNGEHRAISRADRTWSEYWESSETSRNSLSGVHLMLQFHFLSFIKDLFIWERTWVGRTEREGERIPSTLHAELNLRT